MNIVLSYIFMGPTNKLILRMSTTGPQCKHMHGAPQAFSFLNNIIKYVQFVGFTGINHLSGDW